MKKIAPFIITILVCGWISIYIGILFFASGEAGGIGRVFLGVIGIGMVGVVIAMIYTLIIRIKEIDKEDDDDLSKY